MNNLLVSPQSLRRAADVQERILALQAELNQLLTGVANAPTASAPGRRNTMSARGRANIRAAMKRRWAKFRAGHGAGGAKPKRRMSAAAKAKIAAVARARWRKAKAAGRSRL